jgi:hypothetical protein
MEKYEHQLYRTVFIVNGYRPLRKSAIWKIWYAQNPVAITKLA